MKNCLRVAKALVYDIKFMKLLKIAFFGDYYAEEDGVICFVMKRHEFPQCLQGRAGVIVYCLLDFFLLTLKGKILII